MPPAPPVHWPSFLRQIHAIEQSWNAHKVTYPRDDAVHFLPFPIPQFVSMLTDAVMASVTNWDTMTGAPRRATFLDVGCGPGTKIQLAEALFGVRGAGIDIVPAFVAEATQAGVEAHLIDAFDCRNFAEFDIVFVNRPSTLQDELEPLVLEGMAPEAVIIAANWRHSPAAYGFVPIAIEYERPVCGVWRKPAGMTSLPALAREHSLPVPSSPQ